MTKDDIRLKYDTYLNESKRHLNILKNDLLEIENLIPLDDEKLSAFLENERNLMLLDQIAYRYIKLQDILGKLLRVYFSLKGENVENLTMIDIVSLAEKIGFPIDEDLWMELRILRNSITHDYPQTYDEVAKSLNRLYELIPVLEKLLTLLSR